jgi:hypothetical protein
MSNLIWRVTNTYPVTSIGPRAFSSFYMLTNVTIPDSVTNLGEGAFAECSALTSVTIPSSVIGIGAATFVGCTSLTAITVASNNPAYSSLGGVLFDVSQSTLIQFPEGLGGHYAIPNSVTNIGADSFSNSPSLTSVTIGTNVASIGDWAFASCTNLLNFTIPDKVSSLGNYVFFGCKGLTNVNIGAGVANIGYQPFFICYKLMTITVASNNPTYSSLGGVLFDASQSTLIEFPPALSGSYAIPNSVINILAGAFAVCANLTSVNLGTNVTQIGQQAFVGCAVTNVTIPRSVTNIGLYAFLGCASLTSAYFLGNALPDGGYIFLYDPVTVYYLPGTTGWGSTFNGCPTVLWNPQARVNDGSFGLHSNNLGFNIIGNSNLVVVVQACTNLGNPIWTPLQTITLTNGLSFFSDSQWTNYPSRFYGFGFP